MNFEGLRFILDHWNLFRATSGILKGIILVLVEISSMLFVLVSIDFRLFLNFLLIDLVILLNIRILYNGIFNLDVDRATISKRAVILGKFRIKNLI